MVLEYESQHRNPNNLSPSFVAFYIPAPWFAYRFISQFKISQRPRRPIGHQAIRLIFQELVAFGWRNTLRDEKSEKLSNSRSISGRRQTRQASGAGESLRHGKMMGKSWTIIEHCEKLWENYVKI